jgi:hypothetical protein
LALEKVASLQRAMGRVKTMPMPMRQVGWLASLNRPLLL